MLEVVCTIFDLKNSRPYCAAFFPIFLTRLLPASRPFRLAHHVLNNMWLNATLALRIELIRTHAMGPFSVIVSGTCGPEVSARITWLMKKWMSRHRHVNWQPLDVHTEKNRLARTTGLATVFHHC